MMNLRKNIVSANVAKNVTNNGINGKKYIVIHETANESRGANADAHGRLQSNGNSRNASWHYTVDDKEVVQSFDDNAICWHAGNSKYNRDGIGIEICVNSDGNYKKAVENAQELTRQLMSKYGINTSNVIQHNAASGKDCPRYLRNGKKGVTWAQFKAGLSVNKSSPAKTTTASEKTVTVARMAQEVIDGKHGNGHEARRKSLGISASEYDKVRAEVNKRLGSSTGQPRAKTIAQMATEVLEGKHGNGHANRRKSLGVDKQTYGKVRAEVNRRA